MFLRSYVVYILPVYILALWVQSRVKSTYTKYAQMKTVFGLTGSEVVRKILSNVGITDIDVELSKGKLSGSFNRRSSKVQLSSEVYHGCSVAAYGIAAHQVGHVLQYHSNYLPIKIRNGILPVVKLSTTVALPLFVAGLIFNSASYFNIGIIVFVVGMAFHLITLPVELNASSRAIAVLIGEGYLQPQEIPGVKKVLNAVAFSYVASVVMSIAQLYYADKFF